MGETDIKTDIEKPVGLKRLCLFVLFAIILAIVSFCTPLGDFFNKESIAHIAEKFGYLGPAIIILIGTFSPLLFIPRWPIAFVSGMLYGIAWGTLLATTASTFGGLLHFYMAKNMLAPAANRVLKKFKLEEGSISNRKMFALLFFLRAFPLSNFIATNLLAGAMKVPTGIYLAATFFGMLPSSIMYTACGKVLKEPDTSYYSIAAGSIIFIIAGTIIAQKKFYPWLKELRKRD